MLLIDGCQGKIILSAPLLVLVGNTWRCIHVGVAYSPVLG